MRIRDQLREIVYLSEKPSPISGKRMSTIFDGNNDPFATIYKYPDDSGVVMMDLKNAIQVCQLALKAVEGLDAEVDALLTLQP